MKTIHNLRTLTALLVLALFASAGCDTAPEEAADEDLPVTGLWTAQYDNSVHMNVGNSQVSTYEFLPNGTVNDDIPCYFIQDFTVVGLDDKNYTLRDEILEYNFEVRMSRRADVLTTIMNVDGEDNTILYDLANVALGDLTPECQ